MLTRFFDVMLSALALMCLSPLLLLVAVVLRFTGEGDIFYWQKRVGKDNKVFYLCKFATMLRDSAQMQNGTVTAKNDPRVLPVGKVLRQTKVNELPQLFNVIKGDMSLVGPRPQTPECFSAFPLFVRQKIVQVRPGLSGLGAILFRREDDMLGDDLEDKSFYNLVIAPYKGEVELWYVDHQSFLKYVLVIILTVVVVVSPRSQLVWRAFPSLPSPPVELASFMASPRHR